jgi:hypothetical protein
MAVDKGHRTGWQLLGEKRSGSRQTKRLSIGASIGSTGECGRRYNVDRHGGVFSQKSSFVTLLTTEVKQKSTTTERVNRMGWMARVWQAND